ncbi:MAG: tetratricopeptide repeat protein [Pseudomonadota bacterium]
MTFDLEEQEKLDALKDWWKRYGTWLTGALVILAMGAAGAQWWRYHQHEKAVQAAVIYGELQLGLQANQPNAIKDDTATLIDKYPGTPYATRAALISASKSMQTDDTKTAETQLRWVIDHTSEDGIKQLAVLRLAAILLQQKDPAAALKLLDAPYNEAFTARFNDLKGDALVQQNKIAEARASYKIALEKLDAQNTFRKYIEVKLDALGGEPK